MAFGKITKEDLVAAGLDPDKLKEFQEKGVTKDDLTAMKTELATSLTTTVTDLIKNSFTELETKLRTPVRTSSSNNDNNDNKNTQKTPEELEEEKQNAFLTNPTGYVDNQVRSAVLASTVQIVRQSRDMAWREGLRNLRGMKNPALLEEIKKEWDKYTPEKMVMSNTNPELCLQQLHDMILGMHHDEIIQDTNKKDGKYNLVHSGAGSSTGNTGAVGSNTNTSSGKVELSEAEKRQAAKFGMTEDEWIKQGQDMEKEEEDRKLGVLVGGTK